MEKESYPLSLETTRRGFKVNMAAMEEGKIDIVVKLKREQRKKDEPPKRYGKKLPIFQIKVTFVWNNVSLPSAKLFFFWKRENLGRSDDAKQRKKKGMA